MYVLDLRGCPDKEWVYMEALNCGSKVRIKTCVGLTREIKTDRVIKQGAVLSPVQYALSIDEIAKILEEEKRGVILHELNIPCLLWVDDIEIAGINYDEIQAMIDRVYVIARYCKVVFGLDKTKHMILGKDPDQKGYLN